ncbi:MAG: LytTR family DNA-binding domain-containing protein [Candidatus Aminicenantales bacterium]
MPNIRQRLDLLYKDKYSFRIVSANEIDWIEAVGDYVNIHTAKKLYLTLQSLKHLEQELDPSRFIRIHRSSIVNLNAILEIEPWTSGRFKIHLKNRGQIIIRRSGAARLKKFMI